MKSEIDAQGNDGIVLFAKISGVRIILNIGIVERLTEIFFTADVINGANAGIQFLLLSFASDSVTY